MTTLKFQPGEGAAVPYVVLLHTHEAPRTEEWDAYLTCLGRVMAAASSEVQVLVATDGGGPDATQRRQLADLLAASTHSALTHVFTTDTFIRGIVTAFRWIARAQAMAHHPADFGKVCASFGLDPDTVLRDFSKAQRQMPAVLLLRQLER